MTALQPRRNARALQALLVALLIAMLGAIGWLTTRPATESAAVVTEGRAADQVQPGSAAAERGVRGRVWLEAAPTEADDEAAQTEADDGPLSPASDCTVRTWQDGIEVAPPVSCSSDGTFVAAVETAGRHTFDMEVPGRLRATVDVDVPEDGQGVLPDVALGVGEEVSGQVQDALGQPMPGVVVEARPVPDLGETEPWRRTTGAQGAFRFDTLPPGPVALRCAPAGFEATVVEALSPTRDVLVRLGALHDLRGRVLRGAIGPTTAVTVRLEGSGVWPARVVVADAEGAFVFEGVPDGVYAVEAVATPGTDAPADAPAFASVPLEGVEPDLEVTLALVPAHWVDVRVEGPGGDALAGARVSLMNAHVGMLSRAATTDAQGVTRIGPVVPGPYVLRADADGHLASLPLAVQVGGEPLEPQVLRLSKPARVTGTVVDGEGEPVADARVRLRTDALFSMGEHHARATTFAQTLRSAGSLGVTVGKVPPIPFGDGLSDDAAVRTDTDGRFSFGGLVPGQYRLQADHEAFAASDEADVTLRAGASRDVELALRSGHRLTGRVLDGNERPVAGAWVTTDKHGQTWTDDRGTFDVGAHEGKVVVLVRAEGFGAARATVRMRGAPQDVEIQLADADAVLRGHVVDTNGRAIEGALVTVDVRDGMAQSRRVWSDVRGAWELDDLPRGLADVSCTHPDYVETTTTATLGRDEAVALVLETGWRMTLVVRWAGTLEPVEGARVQVVGGSGALATDAQGEAQLDALSPGSITVLVEHQNAPALRRTVKQANAANAELVLALVEGGALEGRVTDYRGDPVASAEVAVVLEGETEVFASRRTGARGGFSFDGLPEGELVVRAWPPPGREEELAEAQEDSDVLRGHTTRDVVVRLERL